jgi:hypothetical protein
MLGQRGEGGRLPATTVIELFNCHIFFLFQVVRSFVLN